MEPNGIYLRLCEETKKKIISINHRVNQLDQTHDIDIYIYLLYRESIV